jgi:hypothetical protein
MATVTNKLKAWITPYSMIGFDDFKNPSDEMVKSLTFTSESSEMEKSGWTFAGDAVVTVQLISSNDILNNKISALKAEAANIRAEATMKCTRIEDQINQLLCIENNPTFLDEQ